MQNLLPNKAKLPPIFLEGVGMGGFFLINFRVGTLLINQMFLTQTDFEQGDIKDNVVCLHCVQEVCSAYEMMERLLTQEVA